jgi:hypothetical protein
MESTQVTTKISKQQQKGDTTTTAHISPTKTQHDSTTLKADAVEVCHYLK